MARSGRPTRCSTRRSSSGCRQSQKPRLSGQPSRSAVESFGREDTPAQPPRITGDVELDVWVRVLDLQLQTLPTSQSAVRLRNRLRKMLLRSRGRTDRCRQRSSPAGIERLLCQPPVRKSCPHPTRVALRRRRRSPQPIAPFSTHPPPRRQTAPRGRSSQPHSVPLMGIRESQPVRRRPPCEHRAPRASDRRSSQAGQTRRRHLRRQPEPGQSPRQLYRPHRHRRYPLHRRLKLRRRPGAADSSFGAPISLQSSAPARAHPRQRRWSPLAPR